MRLLAPSHVLSIKPYIPGQPLLMHKDKMLKLASNENCLGSSPLALEAARRSLVFGHLYPDFDRFKVIDAICHHFKDFGLKASQVAIGNGTSELIVNLVRGLVGSGEAVLMPTPSFVMYRLAALAHGRPQVAVPVDQTMRYDLPAILKQTRSKLDHPVKLIFLANPNNPTGAYINEEELRYFIHEVPNDVVVVIDEAYFEYVTRSDYPNALSYALSRPRTIVLRTMSKAYGLAGLRFGYALGDENIVDILGRIRDPFNVNVVAQHATIAALLDNEHIKRSVEHNNLHLPELCARLQGLGFYVYPSVANFVLVKGGENMPSVATICQEMFARGVLIRDMADFGVAEHVRISVGTKTDLDRLFRTLEEVLGASGNVA